MIYEIDQSYDFEVLPDLPSDNFFNISVDTPSGKAIVQLGKLEFQKSPSYIIPSRLYCRVKNIGSDGLPVLTHVVAPYIYDLYIDTFTAGKTFSCEVMTVPAKPAEEPYMIRDRNGIFYRLNEPDGMLSKGQIVRCRFVKLTPKFFQMEMADDDAKLPYHSPAFLFDAIGTGNTLKRLFVSAIERMDDFEGIRAEIEARNPLWILNAGRMMLQNMSGWFMQGKLQRRHRLFSAVLSSLRSALLYLLEGSGFLNAAPAEYCRSLRQQLTSTVESIEPYEATLQLISEDRQDIFVENLLDKLSKSGYLYHPAGQFAILMLIFRLHPDKVGSYLNRIFESIFGRDLDNWKREPFRSAFVEQFEIYIREARGEIDALPVAESREQKSRLETIITAIALQLLLADENSSLTHSSSLFFRYISLLRPLNSETLLTKSFLSLLGAHVPTRLDYQQLKQPMMMMTRATIEAPGNPLDRLDTTHRYTNGTAELTVSSKGIVLNRSRRAMAERVIPEGLMPWLSPQIMLDGIHGLTGARMRRLTDHHQWWHDIESSLLEPETAVPEREQIQPKTKRRAEPGDEVFVVIERTDDFFSDNPTFVCRIDDNEFEDGAGTLRRDQIVGYNLRQPSANAYHSEDGAKLGFLVTVTDVAADGSYVFSLRDEVNRFIEDSFNYDDEYTVIVAHANERTYSGICYNGIGMYLERENTGCDNYRVGDVVRCRMSHIGGTGQLRAYIVERTDDPDDRFDKYEAFIRLMHSLGEPGTTPLGDSETEEPIRDIDELLTPDDIREITGILRFHAIAETDLIKAYDYLRFARLLAMLIGDDALAGSLSTHASLLSLLQYYSINSRIEPDSLESLKADAVRDPLLRQIYHRLEMVSWLDRPERIPELYKSATEPSNELEGSVARLVLSYNMLASNDSSGDSSIAAEIQQQIKRKLNVNNETRSRKYYGSESKYLEFKTSIVYTATGPGQDAREDPEAQQFHILSRIAGLLNANGGRLYLGVNNDGYEVGLHDDFKYFERKCALIGNYSFRIKNVDNLCVFIENLVNETFGASTGRKIDVSADNEAEKAVIQIDVKESLDPVFLAGRLFVRQSGQATREYHGEAVDEFVREREELRAERAHLLALSPAGDRPAADDSAETDMPEAAPAVTATETTESTETAPDSGDSHARLQTSRWRPNALHYYEPGFVEPYAYLYFADDSSLKFSTADQYMDNEAWCRLALAVPHDSADGSLILGFANERVLRIPLAEVFEKGENTRIEHNSEYPLLFASIATKDDILVCVAADSSDTLWKRAARVGSIEHSHLMSHPKRLHDAPISHTVTYEIADADTADAFNDCLADRLASRRFGVTMRVKTSSPSMQSKIDELVNQCRPTLTI